MIAKLVQKHEKKLNRLLEIIPGTLTWTLITAPVWLGILAPSIIVYLLTFVAVYWVYLAIKHTVGMIVGYGRYTKELKVDWMEKCENLDFTQLPEKETIPIPLNEIKHFLLIPAVNESKDVLKEPIYSILNQTYPVNKVTLVYTIEEKSASQVIQGIHELLDQKESLFDRVLIYTHPAGIPGEAIGAGAANRTWGAKHAVEHLLGLGENPRNYIFSTIDADHVLHKQYLARLTHLYLTSDKRDNRFYSTAVHLFNNNHWNVPTMMRIEANAITLGGISDWATSKPTLKDTFSAYSSSLMTLIDINYWDVSLGVDDTIFYWRAFFKRDGDFVGTPHYIPYSADAVEGDTYLKSYISLYKQLLRWGWGVMAVPIAIKGFLTNKKVPFFAKISWIFRHLERSVLLINVVFLITFGFAILTAVNPNVKQTNFAYSLPGTMSFILTFTLILLIPGTILRFKLASPLPENWPLWKKILAFLEGPVVILNLLTYSFFPFVDAQTRMLLGKRSKNLYYTQKVRTNS